MAGKHSTTIKVSSRLTKEIDAYARRVERAYGVKVPRAVAAEALLRLGARTARKDHEQ